jgi:hypothetical protein
MRKFVLIIMCLAIFMSLKLVPGPAAYAFDFLKSVENAARSVEKTLDDTFDKKKPGSDESLEQNLEQQKQADEKPEIAKQKKTEKDESVVDGVKEQGADMYKTVKGVFVSDDKETPDASKVKEAAQAPEKAAGQAKQSAASAKNAAQAPEKTANRVNGVPGVLQSGGSRNIQPSSPKSPKAAISIPGFGGGNKSASQDRVSATTGGGDIKPGHHVIKEGSWSSCKNKQTVTVSRPGVGMAPSKEVYCMARLDVAARNMNGIGGDVVLRVKEPISEKNVQSFNLRANLSAQSFKVRSGTFLFTLHSVKTKETKNLGVIEIKPDSRHSIQADFGQAVVYFNIFDATGKKDLGTVKAVEPSTGEMVGYRSGVSPLRIATYPGKYVFQITNKSSTNKQFNMELDLKHGQKLNYDVTLSTGEKPPKVGSTQIKKWREIEWLVPAGGKATKPVPEKAVKEQVGLLILFADVNRSAPPRLKVRLKEPNSGKIVKEFEQYAERHPKGKYVKAGKYRLQVEGIDCGRKLDLGVVQIQPAKKFKRDLKLKYTDVVVSVKDGTEQMEQVWLSFKDPATGKVIRQDSGFPKFETYVYPAKYSMELRRTPKDATPMAVVAVDARQGGKVAAKVDLSNVKVAAGSAPSKPVKVKAEANPCGNAQKGMSGCLRLSVKDTDGKPLKYVLDYKSLSGGPGGSYREPMKKFPLTPGKIQFLLKCQGKRKAFVVEAKADQLVERAFVFPAVYKGKVAVNCKMGDGGFGNFGISLYDPETGKRKYSTTDKADGKGTPFEVDTGKYRLEVDYRETKMKKDLGLIEVKEGQTFTKTAVLERGTASLTFYDSKGEMVGPDIRIVDSKTGKLIHAISGPPEPYVFQLAPGKYKVEAKKDYKSKKNIENISIKNNEVLTKDITLQN